MRSLFSRISLTLFFVLISLNAQVLRETRAVWISTNFRLDWPPPTNDSETQKKELVKILDNLKKKNFNSVYFQVRSNGTVLFNSQLEPFAIHLVPQRDFDPLKFAIEESHKRGLEIHAWINVVRLFAGSETSILRNPNHIKSKNPAWVKEFRENGALSYWLDMGLPEVREYLKNVCLEVVQNYNIDGLHFDFLRYPGSNFNDGDSYSLYGNNKKKDDWRRENINSFVRETYNAAKEINPLIKIGAAPIGIYENFGSLRGFEGYGEVYQDAKYWLQAGIIDYIVPQVYWKFGGSAPFEKISLDWLKSKFGRQIIIGTAAYKDDVKPQLNKMIEFTRENNADGIAFFRYENIENTSFNLFDEKAFPVEYSWIKKKEPKAPSNFAYKFENESIQLMWEKPQKNESVFYYGLYSSEELIELFPAEISAIKFRSLSNNFVMNLHLRSIDKAWNESKEKSNNLVIKNPLLNQFYNEVFSGELKPILLKISGRFYLSLTAFQSDEVEIEFNNSQNKNSVSKIEKGKNILALPPDLTSVSEVKLTFKNSGQTISLSK